MLAQIADAVQYGALGLLSLVLVWVARYLTAQAKEWARVLDAKQAEFIHMLETKDAYTRELVQEHVKLVHETTGVLHRMVNNLAKRDCPMVAEDVLPRKDSEQGEGDRQ